VTSNWFSRCPISGRNRRQDGQQVRRARGEAGVDLGHDILFAGMGRGREPARARPDLGLQRGQPVRVGGQRRGGELEVAEA